MYYSIVYIEIVVEDPNEKYSVLFSFLFSQLGKYIFIIWNKVFKRRYYVTKIVAEE